MQLSPDSKGNYKLVHGCLSVFMIVGIILLSGCVGEPMSRDISITHTSNLGQIWEDIRNGMNDRISKTTGRPTGGIPHPSGMTNGYRAVKGAP
ncbi:hypothetical protein AM231_01810 [Paenibacillus solani]|uniref:Uncharacterized protein n=1 Tax=Paenibacillus solani TaxID=1705565 RepID=A0A0M1P0K8_9BACL|nr:hypothetical protein AM231_01810 [Paenibacillus solani]